ncbi:MAG: hypothetical protein CMC93_00420 [Flavobacteriaceae bacterium]|nr:hypothetical protein [Flavobacteriaceae bacterium]|tara:strand:+ start:1161 stop:1427 length:267 start_codon:yes stop_codon:yes gene_type:complete
MSDLTPGFCTSKWFKAYEYMCQNNKPRALAHSYIVRDEFVWIFALLKRGEEVLAVTARAPLNLGDCDQYLEFVDDQDEKNWVEYFILE